MNISTVGVDVCDWIYPKKTDFAFGRADNRTSIKFSTWDFGGQVRLGRGGEGDRRGGVGDAWELSQASYRQFCFGEMITLLLHNFGCLPKKMTASDYLIKNRFGRSQTVAV